MNFQQLFATLSIPSFETVCSRGKIFVIVKALLMSWSRGRSRIVISLQKLGLRFSMKNWKGLRPGFQNCRTKIRRHHYWVISVKLEDLWVSLCPIERFDSYAPPIESAHQQHKACLKSCVVPKLEEADLIGGKRSLLFSCSLID